MDDSRLPPSGGPAGAAVLPFPDVVYPVGTSSNAEGLSIALFPLAGQTAKGLITAAGLHFQCPPLESFDVSYAHSYSDYDTLSSQQSHAGVPQLATLEFSTLVVDEGAYMVHADALGPESMRDRLRAICLAGTPFLLTAEHQLAVGDDGPVDFSTLGPEVHMAATLRALKVSEKAGEGDARYFDVTFTEYRRTTTQRSALGKPKRQGGKKFPTTVRLYPDNSATDANGKPLKSPLTLSYLARLYYGDPSKWHIIAAANRLNVGGGDTLYGPNGTKPIKLTIPSPPKLWQPTVGSLTTGSSTGGIVI